LKDEAMERVGLRPIQVSPISGLPILNRRVDSELEGKTLPTLLTDAFREQDKLRPPRLFEPIGGNAK
ncbi:MAG: hypothetical protein DRO93_15820, partial [Candidatus Thorarchaeota archaeon]